MWTKVIQWWYYSPRKFIPSLSVAMPHRKGLSEERARKSCHDQQHQRATEGGACRRSKWNASSLLGWRPLQLGWRPSLLGLEAIATSMEAIAFRNKGRRKGRKVLLGQLCHWSADQRSKALQVLALQVAPSKATKTHDLYIIVRTGFELESRLKMSQWRKLSALEGIRNFRK